MRTAKEAKNMGDKKYRIRTDKTGAVVFNWQPGNNPKNIWGDTNRLTITDRERGVYVTVSIHKSGNVTIYHDNDKETDTLQSGVRE